MAQFIAFDENVEVSGRVIAAIFGGASHMQNEAEASTLFKQHNLYPFAEDEWYPQQYCLDVLKELDATGDLLGIGMVMIPDDSLFLKMKTIPESLGLINMRYQQAHRGGNAGDYRYVLDQERIGRMICHTPYPAEFDFGILYAIIRHYLSDDTMRIIWDSKIPNRKQGADSCEFIIKW